MEFKDVELARRAYGEKLQQIRKNRTRALTIIYGIIFGLEAIFVIFNFDYVIKFFSGTTPSDIIFGLPMVFSLILVQVILVLAIVHLFTRKDISKEASNYKKAYKAYFIEKQLSSVFQNLEYSHEKGLDKRVLQATGLIDTGDIYESNDFTKGKYKDVDFVQADVHISVEKEEKDQNGHVHRYTVPIFEGKYMIFEFPKKFNFKLMLTNQAWPSDLGPRLNKIETESPNFNKNFAVYAEDGFEAFYILDPAFIERVEKLGQKYPGKIALYFVNNCLYIGIDDRDDSFEPPDPSTPIDEQKEQNKVLSEIKLITGIVDNLRLDYNKQN